MVEEKALVPIEQKQVLFYDDQITAVLVDTTEGQAIYVPIKPVCELLGIDWPSQYQRLRRDPVLSKKLAGIVVTTIPDPVAGGGGPQLTTCLHLDYLNGWLFSINASRVRVEIRNRLIRYQEECYRVLANAFLERPPSPTSIALTQVRDMALAIAVLAEQQMEMEQRITGTESRLNKAAVVVSDLRQRVGHLEKRLAPGQVITEEQAAEISQAVKALAELLTAQGEKKNHYQSIFNELYRRFGVTSYKNIPQGQYAAVMTFLEAWRLSVTT